MSKIKKFDELNESRKFIDQKVNFQKRKIKLNKKLSSFKTELYDFRSILWYNEAISQEDGIELGQYYSNLLKLSNFIENLKEIK